MRYCRACVYGGQSSRSDIFFRGCLPSLVRLGFSLNLNPNLSASLASQTAPRTHLPLNPCSAGVTDMIYGAQLYMSTGI